MFQHSQSSTKNGRGSRIVGIFIAAMLVFGAVGATPGQAMTEGERGGEMSGYYYLNPWAPIKLAFKIVSYAVRIPLYVIKAPWHFVAQQEKYQSQ